MLKVLLEQECFVVIDKPAGVGMHQEGDTPGIVTLAKQRLGLTELYPVHRLDKVTSGALLLARTGAANSELSAAFRRRQVEKYYLALTDRRPSKKQGLIVGDMERSRRSTWKLVQSQTNPAVTQFFSGSYQGPLRWFLMKPATGKTHQIRVAMKSLGSPILGDQLYGPTDVDQAVADRTYLHAWGLRFPFRGQLFEVLAPPESGLQFQNLAFQQKLAELTPPWAQPWPTLPASLRSGSVDVEFPKDA